MKRRRFLTIAAAFACAPVSAQAQTWTGRAMGTDVSVTLHGPRDEVEAALRDLPELVRIFEEMFSLYLPDSTLSKLNRAGQWHAGSYFKVILQECHKAWRLTDGMFDPTIQPLWQALARGEDPATARGLVDWEQVRFSLMDPVALGKGQQLTLNGIAQGFATESIANELRRRGFDQALIDIGEHQSIGGPFDLGLSDPQFGIFGETRLSGNAVATSSTRALRIGDQSHILAPDGRPPLWSTVSIEAPSATMADALSTAAVFMDLPRLKRLKDEARLHRITVLDPEGNIRTV